MTDIEKPVHRRTQSPYDHQGRRVVVSILPGDVIGFRWERTRKTFVCSVNTLMRYTIRLHVEAERAEKKARRKK